MTGMFTESDKEYLDLKFGSVLTAVKELTDKNTKDIDTLKEKTLLNRNDLEHHIKDDKEKSGSKQMNIGYIITICVCIVTVLYDKFG